MRGEVCDVCGSTNIKEIKCKVVCQNCGTILKTCSDLADENCEQPRPGRQCL